MTATSSTDRLAALVLGRVQLVQRLLAKHGEHGVTILDCCQADRLQWDVQVRDVTIFSIVVVPGTEARTFVARWIEPGLRAVGLGYIADRVSAIRARRAA